MLTKEEETRVVAFLTAKDRELRKDLDCDPSFYLDSVRWLAEKLKETNEELKSAENGLEIRSRVIQDRDTSLVELESKYGKLFEDYNKLLEQKVRYI